MSGVVTLRRRAPPAAAEAARAEVGARRDADARHFAWLMRHLARDRFLPAPPEDGVFVGDGDYRAIGLEFLGHFVTLGGLARNARVLDVGCGIGRMAVPLTQYLGDRATYDGFDPVAGGIGWCNETITPAYPRFSFHVLDVAHPLYNPGGAIAGDSLELPFAAASFDFVAMVSIATHLPPAEVARYLIEIARVTAPGGRLFLTAFVMDPTALAGAEGRDPRCGFLRAGDGPAWHADPAAPLGAVAFDDGFLEARLAAAGFALVDRRLGRWRGGAAGHYQDIFVAEKGRAPA